MVAGWTSRSRTIFVAAVLCLLALNLVVLAAAYPETMTIDSGCCGDRLLAKDFADDTLSADPSLALGR